MRAEITSDTNACVRVTKNPMRNTTLTLVLRLRRCIRSNALQSFQGLGDVVTAIKTHPSLSRITQRVATLWLEVSPNVTSAAAWSAHHFQSSTVTIHVFHGEPKFALGENHGPLTCESQLHIRTSLDRAQANSSSVFRIMVNTRIRITGNLATRTEEGECICTLV